MPADSGAVASGALFTAVIESSTAAILTVIGFVNAGLVTFSQAVGMIIGATLGTTSTIWLVAIFGLRFRISAAALTPARRWRFSLADRTWEDAIARSDPRATARAVLETLVWADLALYHAWRLAESLRIASGK